MQRSSKTVGPHLRQFCWPSCCLWVSKSSSGQVCLLKFILWKQILLDLWFCNHLDCQCSSLMCLKNFWFTNGSFSLSLDSLASVDWFPGSCIFLIADSWGWLGSSWVSPANWSVLHCLYQHLLCKGLSACSLHRGREAASSAFSSLCLVEAGLPEVSAHVLVLLLGLLCSFSQNIGGQLPGLLLFWFPSSSLFVLEFICSPVEAQVLQSVGWWTHKRVAPPYPGGNVLPWAPSLCSLSWTHTPAQQVLSLAVALASLLFRPLVLVQLSAWTSRRAWPAGLMNCTALYCPGPLFYSDQHLRDTQNRVLFIITESSFSKSWPNTKYPAEQKQRRHDVGN